MAALVFSPPSLSTSQRLTLPRRLALVKRWFPCFPSFPSSKNIAGFISQLQDLSGRGLCCSGGGQGCDRAPVFGALRRAAEVGPRLASAGGGRFGPENPGASLKRRQTPQGASAGVGGSKGKPQTHFWAGSPRKKVSVTHPTGPVQYVQNQEAADPRRFFVWLGLSFTCTFQRIFMWLILHLCP